MPIGVALRSHSFERVEVQDIYNHVVSIVVIQSCGICHQSICHHKDLTRIPSWEASQLCTLSLLSNVRLLLLIGCKCQLVHPYSFYSL
jgi:hypothetical protein